MPMRLLLACTIALGLPRAQDDIAVRLTGYFGKNSTEFGYAQSGAVGPISWEREPSNRFKVWLNTGTAASPNLVAGNYLGRLPAAEGTDYFVFRGQYYALSKPQPPAPEPPKKRSTGLGGIMGGLASAAGGRYGGLAGASAAGAASRAAGSQNGPPKPQPTFELKIVPPLADNARAALLGGDVEYDKKAALLTTTRAATPYDAHTARLQRVAQNMYLLFAPAGQSQGIMVMPMRNVPNGYCANSNNLMYIFTPAAPGSEEGSVVSAVRDVDASGRAQSCEQAEGAAGPASPNPQQPPQNTTLSRPLMPFEHAGTFRQVSGNAFLLQPADGSPPIPVQRLGPEGDLYCSAKPPMLYRITQSSNYHPTVYIQYPGDQAAFAQIDAIRGTSCSKPNG